MLNRLLVLCLGLLMVGGIAHAGIVVFNLSLNGANESPVNASPATGTAIITIDTNANPNTINLNISYSGLLGNSTAAHIHCCTTVPFTGTAGVATAVPAFPGFPLGATSGGPYNATFNLNDPVFYNPAFVTANGGTVASAEAEFLRGVFAGETYLNIHSTVIGGGEIRAFLAPEPTTMLLMGAGLAGILLLARRRRT